MNRRLQIVNLVGVAVLVLICVLQWRRDRATNLELNRSEKARMALQAKLAEQEQHLRGASDDLALFKEQFTRAEHEAGESAKRFQELGRENQLLSSRCSQLQESVTNWVNAVAQRDKLIAEANGNIRTLNERTRALSEQLNSSIHKFNELATNYQAVAEALNESRRTKAGASR